MMEQLGFQLYLYLGQYLVWLALFTALLRYLPVPYTAKLLGVSALLLAPVFLGHSALFYFTGWLGMASIPTIAVACYALINNGKKPLSTNHWAMLAVLNAALIVPFLAWPTNGYEWGYQTSFGLLLIASAALLLLARQITLFWLIIAATLAWLTWSGTSPNAINYLVDGMMLLAAPVVLMNRLAKAAWGYWIPSR